MRYVNTPETTASDRLAALRKLMAAQDLSPADLGRLLGQPSLARRILRRECPLRDKHLERLGEHFSVAPELVLKLAA